MHSKCLYSIYQRDGLVIIKDGDGVEHFPLCGRDAWDFVAFLSSQPRHKGAIQDFLRSICEGQRPITEMISQTSKIGRHLGKGVPHSARVRVIENGGDAS